MSDALDEETHQELVYPQGDQTLYSDQPFGPVAARKVTEVVQSAVGILKTAIDYPRELITDAARPGYWVPDSEILACSCCNSEFKETDAKHHCRACGMGVCSKCSESRRPVPSKGWDHPVRVCDQCASKKGQLYSGVCPFATMAKKEAAENRAGSKQEGRGINPVLLALFIAFAAIVIGLFFQKMS